LKTPPRESVNTISYHLDIWEEEARIYGITKIKKKIIARNHPMPF